MTSYFKLTPTVKSYFNEKPRSSATQSNLKLCMRYK